MTRKILSVAIATVLAAALGACASNPHSDARLRPTVQTSPSEIEEIAALLDQGEVETARKQLDKALTHDPLNPSLLVLQQGVEGDAKADLGPASYPYTVAPGDTLASIAEKSLGNRLKSYQLARYNDIKDPQALLPGRIIRIPGQGPDSGAPRVTKPKASAQHAEAASPPPPSPPARAQPQTPARKIDAAGAQRARVAGLAALNRGEVSNAVALLQRAAALDPTQKVIQRDLARARRIASTVRSRR